MISLAVSRPPKPKASPSASANAPTTAMNSILTSVVATPIWLTATTTVNAHTAIDASLARKSGLSRSASAVIPRTSFDTALAAIPPMTSTTSATARLGSHSKRSRNTSDTAGNPSASKATTNTMRRTNQFAMDAIMPAESVSVPVLPTKSAKPERSAN